MDTVVVIVGINGWEEYTLPLIESIKAHAPDFYIHVIDNQSHPPYPKTEGVYITRAASSGSPVSYPAAINRGLEPGYDWYIVINNDALFTMRPAMENLDPKHLYGFDIHQVNKRLYLSGWLFFLSKAVIERVGKFDESYKPMYFEDADYCYRCEDAGIHLVRLKREEFGIIHLADLFDDREESRDKWREAYNRNRAYLKAKHAL